MPTCLITGASSGLGRVAAVRLALAGFHVIAVGRDPERLAATRRAVPDPAAPFETIPVDLSDQAEVRGLASRVAAGCDRLDVLINNAAVIQPVRQLAAQGEEVTWSVNYLAPFLLTTLLLDRLTAAAPARVVNVTSGIQRIARLDLDDLSFERRRYRAMTAYGQSKLALAMFTIELAGRLAGTGVTANCLHPGGVRSRLGRGAFGPAGVVNSLVQPLLGAPERAARGLVWLASAPEASGLTGQYLVNRRPPRPPRPGRLNSVAADPKLRQRLWRRSEKQTGTGD